MIQFRLAVALPGLDAGGLLALAPEVEALGLDELWYGDPTGTTSFDATYVITALGGVTAVTRRIRLGAFVELDRSSGALWLAEDLGTLDQASDGRLTLGVGAPRDDAAAAHDLLRRALTAWTGWTVGGTSVPVTPAPAQPFLPRVLASDWGEEAADELGAGLVTGPGDAAPGGTRLRRVLRTVEVDGDDVHAHLAGDVAGGLRTWRETAAAAGADSVLFVLHSADPELLRRSLNVLARVVMPVLRCADFQVDTVSESAWRWQEELTEFHELPPAPAPA